MTLEEIEKKAQDDLERYRKQSSPPYDRIYDCFMIIAQTRMAMALERIATMSDMNLANIMTNSSKPVKSATK